MAEAATQLKPKSDVMTVNVVGRIKGHRFHDKTYYTEVMIPAPDPFSQPSIVETRSTQRLGQSEEDINVMCKLSGFYGRSYSFTDKTTGELVNRRPVNMVLDVIDG